MANEGFGSEMVHPLSVHYAFGCEGEDDVAGRGLGAQLSVCEPPKDEVNVSPLCEPTEIGVILGEKVNGKVDDSPGFQSPKDEVNGDLNCVSPFTSSVHEAPTAAGVMPGDGLRKRRRGRPSKLSKQNVNGAMPLGANGTEIPSGETMKRKRGRPPWKKGINGGMPLLSSCSAHASNGKDVPSIGLPKREVGRPLKLRDDDGTITVSSPSTVSAPLKTEMPSGEPMKKKRGRPWKREINRAMPMPWSSSTASEPVKKKQGRPSKRRSIVAMQRESSSAMSPAPIAVGLLSSAASPATNATDMPSGDPVKRKPGRPPKKGSGGAVYVKRSSASSRALGPRTETLQHSTSHATPERLIGKLPGDGRPQEMAKVGVLETSSSNGMVAQPHTSLLENVSDVDLRQSLPLVAAAAAETLMQEALPLRFPNANLGSLGVGTTVGAVGSREVCGTIPGASHVPDHSQSRLGVIPIPAEYEHLYKEIEERHGRLDNGQPVGQNDTLPYATLVELLSVVQQLKNLAMESVTEGMISSFERTVTIGRLFKFNVGWLHENLLRLRGDYEKRCFIDVVGLEQDVLRCDTWLEATQDELRQMEATYMAAKKKVDDLIKSRNDANAKLEGAREHLKSSEKFSFVI